MPEWLRQPADRIRKATEIAGAHRDNLLLLLKGVLAATAAWFIADTLIGAPSPTFAPFAALLTVQATISGSLKDGMRFAAAMVCGVTLATLVTTLMGTSTASFAGLVLLASALGRWRRLAPQGTQVAVSALFAFAAFLQSDSSTIDLYNVASMVGLALLGCCLGAVTNMVVVPPLRYRSAEYGISTLSRFMAALLMDISKGLRSGSPDQRQAEGWIQRSEDYSRLVAQARAGIEGVAEKMRLNPRRLFQHSSGSYDGHRLIVNALDRAGSEVLSITRAVASIPDEKNRPSTEQDRFCVEYGQFLSVISEAIDVLEGLRRPEDTEDSQRLDAAVDRARSAYRVFSERARGHHMDDPDQWPVYGSLQIDGQRLIDELTHAQSSLKRLATRPRGYAD